MANCSLATLKLWVTFQNVNLIVQVERSDKRNQFESMKLASDRAEKVCDVQAIVTSFFNIMLHQEGQTRDSFMRTNSVTASLAPFPLTVTISYTPSIINEVSLCRPYQANTQKKQPILPMVSQDIHELNTCCTPPTSSVKFNSECCLLDCMAH